MLSIAKRLVLLAFPTIAMALTVGAPAAHADGVATFDVTITRGDQTTTPGTVHSPVGATGRPGVVLVHGSGTGADERYDQIADAFARTGIVVLRYDKRTEDYTPSHRDYSLLADDALAGVRALRARPEVDPARVGLWGLSEGGWVAPLAASRSAEVAFLITIGANGGAPAAQQTWANDTRFRAAGVRGSMLDALARNGVRQVVGADLFAQANYDPVPVLERIDQPVLAIWGDKDRQTPPGDSLRVFQAVFDRIGKANYTLRTLPNTQHAAFRTTDGFDQLPELAPGYAQLVGDWVQGLPGSAAAPSADAPAPQLRSVRPLTPVAWWESAVAQLALLGVIVVGLGGYALGGIVRAWRLPDPWPARALLAAVVVGVVGAVAQLVIILSTRATDFGPLLFGRTLPWLALQLVAIGAVVALALVAARGRRILPQAGTGQRIRWILLVCGGSAFVLWGLYWGLLIP